MRIKSGADQFGARALGGRAPDLDLGPVRPPLVRFKLGRLDDARAAYREIAVSAPHDAAVRRNLGLLALKAERINIREKNGVLKAALSNSAGFNEFQRAEQGGATFSGLMLMPWRSKPWRALW